MPISLPENYQEILDQNIEKVEEIRANYNFLFQSKEKELKQKYQNDFDKIIRNNRSHAILLSDFLKPLISNKRDPKYQLLKNYTLLLLDPLYCDEIQHLPTFDAIIGYTISEMTLTEIYFIEAKSKSVDDEYKEYDKYFDIEIINLVKRKIKEQYSHLRISEKLGVSIHILIYDKHRQNWIESINETKKQIFIWSRIDENDAEKRFKLLWKPNNEDHKLQEMITFFQENLILKTTEFEMSYSLDNIYNLEIFRKNYMNKFKDEPLDLKLSRDIFRKIAKSDYFERKTTEKFFFKELIKLGLEYDILYKKKLVGSDLFFRKGEDLFKDKYVEKKLGENLYQNEEIKKELLDSAIKPIS